jgi:SAM-dependent methyltransferase
LCPGDNIQNKIVEPAVNGHGCRTLAYETSKRKQALQHHAKRNRVAQGYFWLADRLYDELAWAYDPVSRLVSLGQWPVWRRWALEYLVGTRVLEIGFGTGDLLLEMASQGIKVCGLECSAAMHYRTATKMRQHGLWVPRIRGRAQHMPFADNAFDTIVTTFPAGYIFDPATVHEVARLLSGTTASQQAKRGRLVVVGLSASSTISPIRHALRFLIGVPMEDLLAHFEQVAQSAGLRVQVLTRTHGIFVFPIIIAEKST